MALPDLRPLEVCSLSPALVVSLLDGVMARGHTCRFRAGGGSMFPFIRDGDIVSIEPLVGAPRLGDVLAFRRGPCTGADNLVVHRMVGRAAGGYRMRGDSYPHGHTDGVIAAEALLGRVARVERGGRTVHLGLGPERAAIALLARAGLLAAALKVVLRLYRMRLHPHG
jgi:hypothetical protein